MKRWKKILLAVLALACALLLAFAWRQRDNLKAVQDALRYTSDELEEKMEENQQRIRDAVEAAPEVTVRDVTEEERQALRDGTLTQEELVGRLLEGGEDPPPETAGPSSPAQETVPAVQEEPIAEPSGGTETAPQEDPYQEQISALIARVLVLREEYTLALDEMYADAKAAYRAMPEETRTKTALAKMASEYLSRGSALEKECDARMDEIVQSMETLIRDNGGDMALLDTVVYTYANEKSLKKSWYLSEMRDRGLL